MNDNLDKLTPEQYPAKLSHINQSVETHKSKITDTEELAWVKHYCGQLEEIQIQQVSNAECIYSNDPWEIRF